MNETGIPPVRLRPDFLALLPAGLAIFAAAWVLLLRSETGVRIDWDSANYICTARNLLSGRGFVGCGGGDFTAWVPLYPALLAATSLAAGLDPYKVAGPLNAVLFGALVFVVGRWAQRILVSRLVAAWCCLAVALSIPLARISSMALTEPAFLLFATLALIHADRSLGSGGRRALAWAAAFSALAAATRYAGVFIVGAIAGALALAAVFSGGRKLIVWRALASAKGIAAYALASAVPIGAWTAWNDFDKSTKNIDYSVEEAFSNIVRVVGEWASHEAAGSAVGAAVLLLLAAAVVVRGARALRRAPEPGERRLLLFGGFALGYAAFYAYVTVAGWVEHGVMWRHVLPLWIPILFAAALEADRIVAGRVGTARAAVAAALLLWAVWGASALFSTRGEALKQAPDILWSKDSEVLRYVRDNPADGLIWVNRSHEINVLEDGMTAYSQLPIFYPARSRPRGEELEKMFDLRVRKDEYVLWFWESSRNGALGYDAGEIHALPRNRLVAALADGLVFRAGSAGEGGGGEPKPSLVDAVLKRASPGRRPLHADAVSIFDIHVHEDRKHLIYLRRECRVEDSDVSFWLRVHPVRVADLANDRRIYGFDNLDFPFGRTGIRSEGACLAFARLPEYDISHVETGQRASGDAVWKVEIPMQGGAERPAPEPASADPGPG